MNDILQAIQKLYDHAFVHYNESDWDSGYLTALEDAINTIEKIMIKKYKKNGIKLDD